MFILDTNVVSELRRPRADRSVVAWAESIPADHFHLSVITILEIEQGILRVARRDTPQGRRLRVWFDEQILPRFENRILPIDTAVALRCAQLHVPDPRGERDAFIAATALVHSMTVATRDTQDFVGMGVDLVDPWKEPAGEPKRRS